MTFHLCIGGPDTHLSAVRVLTDQEALRARTAGPWYTRLIELGRFEAVDRRAARAAVVAVNPTLDPETLRMTVPDDTSTLQVPT